LLMKCFSVLPFVAALLVGSATSSIRTTPPSEQGNSRQVMLILRGIANAENPRGQLDDESALAYAGRLGFNGEVLDIAGDTYSGSPQSRVWLGHRSITSTAVYTALAPDRFKDFWRD
jgi:hypothetical protein